MLREVSCLRVCMAQTIDLSVCWRVDACRREMLDVCLFFFDSLCTQTFLTVWSCQIAGISAQIAHAVSQRETLHFLVHELTRIIFHPSPSVFCLFLMASGTTCVACCWLRLKPLGRTALLTAPSSSVTLVLVEGIEQVENVSDDERHVGLKEVVRSGAPVPSG